MNFMEAMPVINLTEQCKDGCNLGGPIPTSGLIGIIGLIIVTTLITAIIFYMLDFKKESEKD